MATLGLQGVAGDVVVAQHPALGAPLPVHLDGGQPESQPVGQEAGEGALPGAGVEHPGGAGVVRPCDLGGYPLEVFFQPGVEPGGGDVLQSSHRDFLSLERSFQA